MNQLSKNKIIELPDEIIEYIISFTCDKRGYNIEHYNRRKKENWFRMRRINLEILYFNSLNLSVSWLLGTSNQRKKIKDFKISLKNGNPKVTYYTGCYRSISDEFKTNCRLNF